MHDMLIAEQEKETQLVQGHQIHAAHEFWNDS